MVTLDFRKVEIIVFIPVREIFLGTRSMVGHRTLTLPICAKVVQTILAPATLKMMAIDLGNNLSHVRGWLEIMEFWDKYFLQKSSTSPKTVGVFFVFSATNKTEKTFSFGCQTSLLE